MPKKSMIFGPKIVNKLGFGLHFGSLGLPWSPLGMPRGATGAPMRPRVRKLCFFTSKRAPRGLPKMHHFGSVLTKIDKKHVFGTFLSELCFLLGSDVILEGIFDDFSMFFLDGFLRFFERFWIGSHNGKLCLDCAGVYGLHIRPSW